MLPHYKHNPHQEGVESFDLDLNTEMNLKALPKLDNLVKWDRFSQYASFIW